MTFEQRLQKLEQIAATHSGDDEPSRTWLSAAPEPIQRYVAAVVEEYWRQVDTGNDEESAAMWVLERHPLYRPLQSLLIAAANAGQFANLRRIQAHLLYIAGKKLPFYPWPEQRGRLIQRDYTNYLCARATLATPEERANYEVEAWRESGSADAAILCAAGIGALELELLSADG
jgi:hypothetical protein